MFISAKSFALGNVAVSSSEGRDYCGMQCVMDIITRPAVKATGEWSSICSHYKEG